MPGDTADYFAAAGRMTDRAYGDHEPVGEAVPVRFVHLADGRFRGNARLQRKRGGGRESTCRVVSLAGGGIVIPYGRRSRRTETGQQPLTGRDFLDENAWPHG